MKCVSLHSLRYNLGSVIKRKIVGRGVGSGHGCKCGKGSNGNKQRSGYRYRPGFEGGQTPLKKKLPMIRRINKFRKDCRKTLTTDMFVKIINSGVSEINREVLVSNKIIKAWERYKVVRGKVDDIDFKSVVISGDGFSEGVRSFIESKGGKCLEKGIE